MIRHLIFMTLLAGLGACVDDSRASLAEDMGVVPDAPADAGDAGDVDTGTMDGGDTNTKADGGDFVVPYFCDEPGMVAAKSTDLLFELPAGLPESPGPITADFFNSDDVNTTTFTVPTNQKTNGFRAIWKPLEDDLVFYTVYNVALAYDALRLRYVILLDYQPVPAKITVWDRDRTQILDQYTGYVVDRGVIQPGESLVFDVEIDQSYLPEARTYDLILAGYEDLQNTGHQVDMNKIVVFNGSFDIPAHPCFVKASPLYAPTFVPTADEAALHEARLGVGLYQNFQIWVDGHLLESASVAPHEIDVTGKTSAKIKILGYPPSAKVEMGPWIAEVIFPVLGDAVLPDRWNVAFPRTNGGEGKPYIPVWRGEFEVPLPEVPSVDLQLLGTHTPYVPNVDPDGTKHPEAPILWDQRSNVIRFVRTDVN